MIARDALVFRRATHADLPAIVALYADDDRGGHADAWTAATRPAYEAAFAAIDANPRDALMVIAMEGAVIGTFLLTLLPGLTGRGSTRLQLRSVEIAAALRSRGIGAHMLAYVDAYARDHGAALIELTSNESRPKAHRFYLRHGFLKSHAGFKKKLL